MACQMSSMRSAGLPTRNGFRYFSTAAHEIGALRERAAAIAVQSVLIGDDLDDDQPEAGGRGGDHLNIFDFGEGMARVARLCLLLRAQAGAVS